MASMEHLIAFSQRHPVVAAHLVAALVALLVGAIVLARRKGTLSHKRLGWIWVGLMAVVATSSLFIRGGGLPNVAGFSPIHLITLFVAVMLPRAVILARRGDIVGHRRAMKGMFYGGGVIAGVFTLLPGRFLGNLLWHHTLHLI